MSAGRGLTYTLSAYWCGAAEATPHQSVARVYRRRVLIDGCHTETMVKLDMNH